MPKKLFRWCNSVTRDLNVNVLKPKLAVTEADVGSQGNIINFLRHRTLPEWLKDSLLPQPMLPHLGAAFADPLMPEKSFISPCCSQLEEALMSQFWRVNKNPYIFSLQRTLNQPCKPPPTDCRCKPLQQLAKNVAYSVVWPILVSRSLLPTQLCPCCSTKMNWPSTLLLASFQQMLIHSAQGSGKLSRYFQTRCWCTWLHLNSECRPLRGPSKPTCPSRYG